MDVTHEIMTTLNELEKIEDKAFENVTNFLNNCWGRSDKCNWDDLIDFYIGSENCRVSILLECGTTITDIIKTLDVIKWYQAH